MFAVPSFTFLDKETPIALAGNQTIGTNITHLAFEMNGGMGELVFGAEMPNTLLDTRFSTVIGQIYTGGYQESPDGPPLPVELQRELRRGYYASVSFLDFEV